MRLTAQLKITALLLISILLTACGGGSSASTTGTLSGVAAVGTPIVGGNISVICVSGSELTPTTTDSNGFYSVTLYGQALPCAVQVAGGTINGAANTTPYQSIATTVGTVNITPLTDLLVANLTGSATPSTWFTRLDSTPFTGRWTGNYNGSPLVFYINQTGSSIAIISNNPTAGITYSGTVSGNILSVNEYLNNTPFATLTFTLTNSTTINAVITSSNPPPGYTAAALGSAITLTGDGNAQLIDITQTQVNTALGYLSTALPALTSLSVTNPITTAFTPTSGNVSDDMLTALASTGVAYTSLLSKVSGSLLSNVSGNQEQRIQDLIDSFANVSGRSFTAEQRSLLSSGVKALLQISEDAANRNDLALVERNIDLFLDNVQQVLQINFSSNDKRLLTRGLVRLCGYLG